VDGRDKPGHDDEANQLRHCEERDEAIQMGWLPPSPDGIAMCQDGGVEGH